MLKKIGTVFFLCFFFHERTIFSQFLTLCGGGWMRQRCRESCVTGASNWYRLTVGIDLLCLQQVKAEAEYFYFCFFAFIHFPLSPLSLSSISTISSISLLPFSGRRQKSRASRWRAIAYPRASAIAYLRAHQNSKCVPPVLIHRAITCDSFKVLAQKA